MDFFSMNREKQLKKNAPLADRMRPTTLEEYAGQKHILGPGKPLTRLIMADKIPSMIFYGPPGTGKTTLAEVIANTTSMSFQKLSAVTSGVKDLREVLDAAKDRLAYESQRTILFIDEIHRFNKAQQDALLPHVENGSILLIGATTENPFFEVNKALLSRCQVMQLHPLTKEDLEQIFLRAIKDPKGLGDLNLELDPDAFSYLLEYSAGDARIGLNSLEIAVLSTPEVDGKIHITLQDMEESMQKKVILYDRDGDEHYNTISAFIKSMRGSDPDAALYYLAKMLEAGEEPRFIGRRMMIFASEDIGNADPYALTLATSCFTAVHQIGMPEAQIILAQTVAYLATAPKSNASYKAIMAANKAVKKYPKAQVPDHLKDSHYSGAKKLGHGIDYKYPHDYPGGFVLQNYLPDGINKETFYQPKDIGYEQKIKQRMDHLRGLRKGEKDAD